MGDSGGPRGVPETWMLCPPPSLSTGTQENQNDFLWPSLGKMVTMDLRGGLDQ